MATHRLPAYAISHGGGPWPWIKDSFGGDWSILEGSLQSIPDELPMRPRAILMVTAHWIGARFTVQGAASPGMVYDYGGFPEFTYRLSYPAPGSPSLAAEVAGLLRDSGTEVDVDERRGFDHGTFVPLAVAFPDADVPVVQLSVKAGFDVGEHLAVGRALAPLRDDGVLIVGSGVPSFHDLSKLGPPSSVPSTQFDRWLTEVLTGSVGAERSRRLAQWESAPSARACHPEADHLAPLIVTVGAAEDEVATVQYHEDAFLGWTAMSAYRLGTPVRSSVGRPLAAGARQ